MLDITQLCILLLVKILFFLLSCMEIGEFIILFEF